MTTYEPNDLIHYRATLALIKHLVEEGVLTEKEYRRICSSMGYISDHYDSLQATLTDKQKEILEKFEDCHAELTDINKREIFVYAFRLGAKIAIEMLSLDI